MTTSPSNLEASISVCGHCETPFTMTKHDNRRRYCSTLCAGDSQRRRSKKSLLRQRQREDDKLRAAWLGKIWTKGKAICKQT